MIRSIPAALAAALLVLPSLSARAGSPGGVAMILGATVHAVADSGSIPLPRTPADLVRRADGRGLYDVSFWFFSRRPLAGAWSIAFSLEYDRRPGSGIDILSWSHSGDRILPAPSWPEGGAGAGLWLGWQRFRCLDPDLQLLRGEDGWYLQPVVRLRVMVHGPDRLLLADAEPGRPASVVQCDDEEFRLDGVDGWTAYLGAEFESGEDPSGAAPGDPESTAPVVTSRWSDLKARFGSSGWNDRRPVSGAKP